MTDKLSQLHPLQTGLSANIDAGSYFNQLSNFVKESEILQEWDDTDVDLSHPNSDEKKLGQLTYLERQLYVLSQLLNQILREEIIEVQASNADGIAKLMREHKVSIMEATSMVQQNGADIPPEAKAHMFQVACTSGAANSMFEWLVRTRYDEWSNHIIVRKGFVAHAYD